MEPAATAAAAADTQPAPQPTATDAATSAPSSAAPTAAPTVDLQTGPARVTSALLRPATVSPGATLTASVQTTGAVSRVELYLSAGPTGPPPLTFVLSEIAPGSWSAAGTAPSMPGDYHYTVGLYSGGHRTNVDDDSWSVTVAGASSSQPSGQVESLPADIPLAPPFSYGNPVAATFSAVGQTINGSEVVSTTRTDVPPATVSQFYTDHLPRAGWNVVSGAVPAGATSFTMVGTSGNRVVVVQYAGYTVHVFYGSTAH